MKVQDKIRSIREIYQWTQEDMAEKMGIATSSYSKLERGESKLDFEKLKTIAQIFNISMEELISQQGMVFIVNANDNNGDHSANFYSSSESLVLENEKLKLELTHCKEMLLQKDKEIELLRRLTDK